jgi:NAD(P)-dependent dehydrogenase (short-subunit alcohol dehydrogenase family)
MPGAGYLVRGRYSTRVFDKRWLPSIGSGTTFADNPDQPSEQPPAYTRGFRRSRVGEAAAAGDLIAFLCSDRAAYITGTAINLDGGASSVV